MGSTDQQPRSWQEMRQWQIDTLERKTQQSLAEWNEKVAAFNPKDEAQLRVWLADQDVTGYSQMLLVHERFGYPDFFTKSANELIDAQFSDREQLREIYDAVLALLPEVGEVIIQARKTFTGLQTPRRTFAVLAPVTKNRVDLGLRWDDAPASPRLTPPGSRLGGSVTTKLGLQSLDEIDDEVLNWLQQAYRSNL